MTTSNTEGEKPVQVKQADRDAAAAFINSHKPPPWSFREWLEYYFAEYRIHLAHQPDTAAEPVVTSDLVRARRIVDTVTEYCRGADFSCDMKAATKAVLPMIAQPAPQPVGDVERLREALRQARDDLLTVGNDYPGSSCQQWCTDRARAAWDVLEPWKHCPSTHCERAQECRSVNECSANKAALSQHPDPQPQTDVVERDNAEALRRAILTELDNLDPVDAEADSWIQGIADAMDVVRAFALPGESV